MIPLSAFKALRRLRLLTTLTAVCRLTHLKRQGSYGQKRIALNVVLGALVLARCLSLEAAEPIRCEAVFDHNHSGAVPVTAADPFFNMKFIGMSDEWVPENERWIQYLRALKADPVISGLPEADLIQAAREAARMQIGIHPTVAFGKGVGPNPLAQLNFVRYQLRLKAAGIDPNGRPPSFAAIARKFGHPTLSHHTNLRRAEEILLSGALRPMGLQTSGSKTLGGKSEYVYLEALPRRLKELYFDHPERADWVEDRKMVFFEIDSRVLDEVPWSHMSFQWMFGEYSEKFSVRPTNSVAAFFNVLEKYDRPENELPWFDLWGARNEILMSKEVNSARYIRAIHVAPEAKAQFIKDLIARGCDSELLRLIK